MTNWPGNQGGYYGPPQGPPQSPPPGWGPPQGPPQGWAPQPGWGGPPPKNRKPLIISLIAGAAVLVVVAIIAVIALSGGDDTGRTGSAGDAITGYLDALGRGDAEAALAYSDEQPGSKEFLTDEVLKKQIEKLPITDIKILSDDSASMGAFGRATVHVSVKFGDQVSDETLMLKKSDKQWKLDHAATKLDRTRSGTDDKSLKVVTLFGQPLPDSVIYVFPGWLDIGTSNPNLSVSSKSILLDGLSGYGSLYSADITVDINEAGAKAAQKAVRDAIEKCTRTSSLRPPNCPNGVDDSNALENSAAWGAPAIRELDVSGFSRYTLESRFNIGRVEFPVTIKTSDGATKNGNISAYVSGKIDMSQNPPGVSFTG